LADRKGPVLIELDEAPSQGPESAPPVPDAALPAGQAMQVVASLGAKRPSRIGRLFWVALLSLVGFVVSLVAWNFVTGLLAANPILGWTATGLLGLVLFAALVIALRELAAFSRLARLDGIHQAAQAARAEGDLGQARAVVDKLSALYRNRSELRLGREDLAARQGDVFEVDDLFSLTEAHLLAPLDQAASREVEAAARQVATITALVPIALADVIAALTSNLRMIRRIAEIYGGRSGTLGAWRLTRAVLTHLVATGAVAVGDDLIGSLAGGSVLAKISRRFGEGLVNGALTARVGVAAMEVCRPLPFGAERRPSVTALVRRALTGLFDRKG